MKQVDRLPGLLDRRTVGLVLFMVLNALDAVTTHAGLAAGFPEVNPVPAMVLALAGESAMLGARILAVASAFFLVLRFHHRFPRLWIGIYVLDLVFAIAVVGNLRLAT